MGIVSLYIEKRNFVNNFGLNTFLEAEWARLRVPAVLRTFWISRAALLLILQDGLWESLDDCVYYIRAFGNSVEFCFAVFLFFNGGWILLFESGGTIRAIMMLIHAYFNIWCEAKNGWSTFSKRRTAVAKINSLQDATEEQLEKHNDVCSICYQDMACAKVTRCRHIYHAICLRKWLYMQDSCPMCHEKLYQTDATSQTEDVGEVVRDVGNGGDAEEGEEQDLNQNYVEEESDDYIDITDSEELE